MHKNFKKIDPKFVPQCFCCRRLLQNAHSFSAGKRFAERYLFIFIVSILERGRAWLIIELPWGGNNNKNYTIEVGALPSQSVKELHTQVICGCIIVGLVVGWYRFCFVFASCLFQLHDLFRNQVYGTEKFSIVCMHLFHDGGFHLQPIIVSFEQLP